MFRVAIILILLVIATMRVSVSSTQTGDEPIVDIQSEIPVPEVGPDQSTIGTTNENQHIESLGPIDTPSSNPTAETRNENRESDSPVEAARLLALDLDAQIRMAKAAEQMSRYSRWQIVLSALGILLLGWTLFETRRATKTGHRSALAAEYVVMQDRAWLIFNADKEPKFIRDSAGKVVTSERIVSITNKGKSPALNVHFELDRFTSIPGESDFGKIIDKLGSENGMFLGPSQSLHAFIGTEQAAIDKIKNHGAILILYICAQYETVYGEIFLIEWTQRVVAQPASKSNPERTLLLYEPIDKHNGIRKIGQKNPQSETPVNVLLS